MIPWNTESLSTSNLISFVQKPHSLLTHNATNPDLWASKLPSIRWKQKNFSLSLQGTGLVLGKSMELMLFLCYFLTSLSTVSGCNFDLSLSPGPLTLDELYKFCKKKSQLGCSEGLHWIWRQWSVAIKTISSLPVHEHWISFHLFRSLISFSDIL